MNEITKNEVIHNFGKFRAETLEIGKPTENLISREPRDL